MALHAARGKPRGFPSRRRTRIDPDTRTFVQIIQIAVWLGLTYLTAKIAFGRGRSVVSWTIFGLMAPVLALICALCLSKNLPKQEEDAHALTTLSLNMPTDKPKPEEVK